MRAPNLNRQWSDVDPGSSGLVDILAQVLGKPNFPCLRDQLKGDLEFLRKQ